MTTTLLNNFDLIASLLLLPLAIYFWRVGFAVSKPIQYLIAPFTLTHEIWHYLAAKSLGLEADLYILAVLVERSQSRWKRLVVALAPSFFGTIILSGLIWVSSGNTYLWILLVAWHGGCLLDYKNAWDVMNS